MTDAHDQGCPLSGTATLHSDAARRYADAVNLHVAALGWGAVKKWVAVRLSDGGSDGVLYDTRDDAIAHQLHETQCAYVCVQPGGTTACRAESFLRTTRAAYVAGAHWTGPGSPEIIRRLTRRDQAAQVARILARSR